MLRLDSTHAEIGKAVGLSRPQITNVINGQFGVSRRVVRRVLELAKAA
jgi:DNA-binding LacI/PurR family transcriptional regulator